MCGIALCATFWREDVVHYSSMLAIGAGQAAMSGENVLKHIGLVLVLKLAKSRHDHVLSRVQSAKLSVMFVF